MNEEQKAVFEFLNTHALGYGNRKSSTQIREALNLESGGATNEHVRDLIRDLILNHNACIGSLMWKDGYWIIQTEEELKEIEDRSKATIDDAVEFAKESPFADGSIAFQDNYAD